MRLLGQCVPYSIIPLPPKVGRINVEGTFHALYPAEMQHLGQNHTWPNPNFTGAGPDLQR